jgi:Fe2+ or Zn2+ uptake regulation protein
MFCFHKYKVVKVFNYDDVSYGDTIPSHVLIMQCKKCGKVKEKTFYGGGHISITDFNQTD